MVIELLCGHWASYWTSHTGKWSLNCTYRKMKTESMISLSTKISQFSIHKWFLRVQRLQRIRPKQTTKKLAPFLIFGRHFLPPRSYAKHNKILDWAIASCHLCLFLRQCVYNLSLCFRKKTVLMICILPFLSRLQTKNYDTIPQSKSPRAMSVNSP